MTKHKARNESKEDRTAGVWTDSLTPRDRLRARLHIGASQVHFAIASSGNTLEL